MIIDSIGSSGRSPRSLILVAGLASVLVATAATPARAAQRSGETVVVPRSEVVPENLYIGGSDVTMHGTVNGDLVVMAGEVDVDGVVLGDVIAAGGQVRIAGDVRGDVRAAGGQVSIQEKVRGDAMAVGGRVELGADVGQDAAVGAGEAVVSGAVGRDLYAAAGQVRVLGRVSGSLQARAQNLELGPRARVDGNVLATTGEPVELAPGAVVAGQLQQRRAEPMRPPWQPAVPVIAWLQALVGLFLLGLLWTRLFRGFSERAVRALRTRALPSLGVGLAVFAGVPLAVVFTFILGAIVGGWFLGFFGLAIYGIALALTVPLVALAVGSVVFERLRLSTRRTWLTLLLSLAALLLVLQIPVLGPLLGLLTVLFGLGAIALAMVRTLRRTRHTDRIVEPEVTAAPLPAT